MIINQAGMGPGILEGVSGAIDLRDEGASGQGDAQPLLAPLLADGHHLESIVQVGAFVVLGLEHPPDCRLVQAADQCHLRPHQSQMGRSWL